MTKSSQPQDPFGIASAFAQVDPTQIMSELAKGFRAYEGSGVDVRAIIESQRKNIETLQAANRRAIEGAQAIASRQQQILQQTIEEATQALKALSASGTPQDAVSKQTELLQAALTKATQNMRELAEMAAKANYDVVDTVNQRISESLDEIRKLAAKP